MQILNQAQISKILDIGSNFLFVDSFENLNLGIDGRATYIFDERHKFIKSHFTSKVVIPGALIMESMLQAMALTIYNAEYWEGIALVANVNIKFLEPLHLQSRIDSYCKILINSAGRVEGEVTCSSNEKIVGTMKCTYYSSHLFDVLKKNAIGKNSWGSNH